MTAGLKLGEHSIANALTPRYKYCTNCKVGGHGQRRLVVWMFFASKCGGHGRFCEYLLERPDWRVYPNQKWFEAELNKW